MSLDFSLRSFHQASAFISQEEFDPAHQTIMSPGSWGFKILSCFGVEVNVGSDRTDLLPEKAFAPEECKYKMYRRLLDVRAEMLPPLPKKIIFLKKIILGKTHGGKLRRFFFSLGLDSRELS